MTMANLMLIKLDLWGSEGVFTPFILLKVADYYCIISRFRTFQ
jgi:hypothetical protein